MNLSDNHLVELGVLLELTSVGLFQPSFRVAPWEAEFIAMAERTHGERDFWDRFVWLRAVADIAPET